MIALLLIACGGPSLAELPPDLRVDAPTLSRAFDAAQRDGSEARLRERYGHRVLEISGEVEKYSLATLYLARGGGYSSVIVQFQSGGQRAIARTLKIGESVKLNCRAGELKRGPSFEDCEFLR